MTSSQTKWAHALAALTLVGAGLLIGALLAEIAYRAYLVHRVPARFQRPPPEGIFGATNVSSWEFDSRFGYVYPPSRVVDFLAVSDGRVSACVRSHAINEFGNMGPVAGDWKSAALKIAVFGDSFTAYNLQGVTWPNFLQKALEERLKRPVAVMNFGRDGYGLLQMFDLAAAKVEEWKPDVAVIAFITDDLTRGRFWRTVVGEGDDQRVLTTLDPVANPAQDRAVDTSLLMASATYEWCQAMLKSKGRDDILRRLIEKHRLLRLRVAGGTPELWDLRHSYLFNRLSRSDPFWHVESPLRTSQNPRHSYSSYLEDARTVENLRRLRTLGSELVLFHLAFYPEIKAAKEYIASPQEERLLQSLETSVGAKILRTTDYVRLPVERPERMNSSAADFHPSLWGMELYADAVADALFKERIVDKRAR